MELYHALNRGVDKREIFLDEQDYARFVHDLYEFNDAAPAGNAYRRFDSNKMMDLRSPSFATRDRKRIVDVHGWVLMKNHYHLLLSGRVEGGVTQFLRKLNIGYAKYFNEKYERCGTLFQGRTKKVLIEEQAHFLHILHYIHLNPLDYLEGSEGWRIRDKGSVRTMKSALAYLQNYKWSSYLDYSGTKSFPSIITTSLFKNEDVFDDYPKAVANYLREIEIADMGSLVLE